MPFTVIQGGKDATPPLAAIVPPTPTRYAEPPPEGAVDLMVKHLRVVATTDTSRFEIIRSILWDGLPGRLNDDDRRRSHAILQFFTGHWMSDTGLMDVLAHWANMRKSDRLHVGTLAAAFATADTAPLRKTVEHVAKRFSREQSAELAAILQRSSLGNPSKISTDADARTGRAKTLADSFSTLTDQQQTHIAAIVVALANRNDGAETDNTAATVRASVVRFIRHTFHTADVAKIVKACMDFIAN